MADTIREKIIAAMTSTLKNYSEYTTISSPDVHRGRIIFDPDVDPLPLISVVPRVESAEPTTYQTTDCTMPVDVSCLVPVGESNPSELGEAVLGELIKAALSAVPSDAESIFYTGGGIDEYPDEMGQAVLTVGISLSVKYKTDTDDPYNLTT